jgi:hypothetical protein
MLIIALLNFKVNPSVLCHASDRNDIREYAAPLELC